MNKDKTENKDQSKEKIKVVKKSSLLRLRTYAGATAQKVSTFLLITFAILLLILGKVDENNLKESISDLYSKSLLTLQYGASLNFNKLSFDFRIDKGFGDREIVYAEQLLGENKNQIVKTDGLLTMISVSYKF